MNYGSLKNQKKTIQYYSEKQDLKIHRVHSPEPFTGLTLKLRELNEKQLLLELPSISFP